MTRWLSRTRAAAYLPIERWHPVEERWEDAEAGLPQTDAQLDAEQSRRQQDETDEAQEEGYAEWEVRIDLANHGDAVAFAEHLESEGISPIVRRWKYILIGTPTEEAAQELAARLEGEAPQGATVRAEPSAAVGWEITSNNPFSIFGGIRAQGFRSAAARAESVNHTFGWHQPPLLI